MNSLEEQLVAYRNDDKNICGNPKKILETIQASKEAFYEVENNRKNTYFEFLWEQVFYIKKYWWILQFLVLTMVWIILLLADTDVQIKRNMGVVASMFVIIVIPELWKNKSSGSMEIEGTTYYSLRQIYAARMFLFAFVDVILLTLFFCVVSFTTQITIKEMLIHFLLPLNVNCCICARLLFSRRFGAEYIAVAFCIIWTAIWSFILWNNMLFELISLPALILCLIFCGLYLVFCLQRVMKNCDKFWEANITWN